MKQFFVFFLLYTLPIVCIYAQNQEPIESQDTWGDYYFINAEYAKAVSAYSSFLGELSLAQQRNFAEAFARTGEILKAKNTYTAVANSIEASVNDYYRYATLLKDENALANEYREKALRLAWTTPSLFANDSLLFKKRFNSTFYAIAGLKGNTANNEFGLLFLSNDSISDVLYLSDQEKSKKRNSILKRIKTDLPIYNFYPAKLNAKEQSFIRQGTLSSSINSDFQEGPGSYDSKTDYFYFSRSTTRFDQKKTVQLNIYRIKRAEIAQNKIAESLGFNLEGSSAVHPSISPDGKRLYFASDRPNGYGGMDLYYVTIVNNQFSTPVNLGPDVNTAGDEVFPYSFDTEHLFYSSNGKDGLGKMDIFLAEHRIEKRWETFVLGKSINSSQDDFSFGLNKALNLGFFASNREGGKGQDDLYTFPFKAEISGLEDAYIYVPSDTLVVATNGVLQNDIKAMNDKDPLQRLLPKAAIQLSETTNGSLTFNSNGSFLYKSTQALSSIDSFAYAVKTSQGQSKEIWVKLKRAEVKASELTPVFSETFAPIFYNLDKSTILQSYLDRVDRVVKVMRDNPSLEVEVSSYTDCRGSSAYNLRLSKKRTNAILSYVRERIEKPERIYGEGYGELSGGIVEQNEFQLVAGSFTIQSNATALIDKLRAIGYKATLITKGQYFKVVAAESNKLSELERMRKVLQKEGVGTWINTVSCEQMSEEEYQLNRRTDFKLIRL